MKTITMNSITLELNEKHAPANRAALDELVRELKYNGGSLFSASVSPTDATFNIEPQEQEKERGYFISYHWKDGDHEGIANAFHKINGKMTMREISKFEMKIEQDHGHQTCTVINFHPVEFS